MGETPCSFISQIPNPTKKPLFCSSFAFWTKQAKSSAQNLYDHHKLKLQIYSTIIGGLGTNDLSLNFHALAILHHNYYGACNWNMVNKKGPLDFRDSSFVFRWMGLVDLVWDQSLQVVLCQCLMPWDPPYTLLCLVCIIDLQDWVLQLFP
jgi:hypothetical protein